MNNENQNRPEAHPLEIEVLETRTTAQRGHPERQCRRCGEPVQGRRRNGYCSDACRMRDQRENRAAHLASLLRTIEKSVAALRAELEGDHETL